jgi:ankyrin repeat protein
MPSNKQYVLVWAASKGELETVKNAVEQHGVDFHFDDEYPLRVAINCGHLDVVRYLVEQGANVHIHDNYVLRWAAEHQHFHVMEYIFSKFEPPITDEEEMLYWASYNKYQEYIQFATFLKKHYNYSQQVLNNAKIYEQLR